MNPIQTPHGMDWRVIALVILAANSFALGVSPRELLVVAAGALAQSLLGGHA